RRPRLDQAAPEDDRQDHLRRRHREERAHPVPHRYGRRTRLLQERRHPAVCAARSGGVTDHQAHFRTAGAKAPAVLFWANEISPQSDFPLTAASATYFSNHKKSRYRRREIGTAMAFRKPLRLAAI